MPPHIGPSSSIPPAPPSMSSAATAPSVPHHVAIAATVTAAEQTRATGPDATPAVTHAEMNLPDSKHARQPTRSPHELFAQAAEHKEHLDNLIDRGKGLSHALGFHVVEGSNPTPEDYVEGHRKGGMVMLAPLKHASEKGMARTRQKAEGKYKGDYSKLRDLSRASVAVSHPDDIPYVMHTLRQHGLNLGSKPDDRFAKPTEAGYSDLQTEHVAPNGHRGELQIHSLDHHEAKEQGFHGIAGGVAGHKMYEEIREMPEDAADLSPAQAARKAHLEGESKKLYGEAQRRAEGRKANLAHLPVEPVHIVRKSTMRFAHRVAGTNPVGVHHPMAGSNYSDMAKNMDTFNQAGQPGCFDFDGVPAHRENAGDRPRMFNGAEWVPVDPGKFAHQASRIEKHKFDEMVAVREKQHREFLDSQNRK